MERIKRELTEAGIPYASEYLGGNIIGLRIGNMYVVEHGSGQGYYFGNLENESYTCRTIKEVIKLAKHEEEIRKMEEKLKEIFDLERIRKYAETNISLTEWVEKDCGETRKILLIATLVEGGYGAYIPGMVLELFGQAEGYDLENPYNFEKNEAIYDALISLEIEVNECLNQLLPSKGWYYMGYHEADGSYCLFYEECEEEMEQV